MKTKPVVLGLLVGTFVIGYVVFRQFPFFRGLFLNVNASSAAKLRPGMTMEEMTTIIGVEPGRYTVQDHKPEPMYPVSFCYAPGHPPPTHVHWVTTFGGAIEAEYGHWFTPRAPDERAGRITFYPARDPDVLPLLWDVGYAVGYGIMSIVMYFAFAAFFRSKRFHDFAYD